MERLNHGKAPAIHRLVRHGCRVFLGLALAATLPVQASSVLGGAPGRADTLKRATARVQAVAAKPERRASSTRASAVSMGPMTPLEDSGRRTAAPPVLAASPTESPARLTRTLTYEDVLDARQKAQLRARADVLSTHPGDYQKLLTPDEHARLEALLRERQQALTPPGR